MTLSAYIHFNHVRAKKVEIPENYRWSSYPLYLNQSSNDLIDPATVLNYAGSIENYIHILNEMIDEATVEDAIYGKWGMLGKDSFKEKLLRRKEVDIKSSDMKFDTKSQPEFKSLKNIDIEKIKNSVVKFF